MDSNISIASCARLCELNISVVTGSKQDKDATSKVNEDNNAADNVARVTKNIFAHSEMLPDIVKFAALVRQEHLKLSLPFNDSGQRLIPNTMIQKHMEIMGKNKQEFLEKVEKFKEELPQLREHAEDCLGELYNEYDYPSEEEVEIMSDNNCREYAENDYVSLKNGGEGRIVKIIYVVMDNEEEVLILRKLDIGNISTKDL